MIEELLTGRREPGRYEWPTARQEAVRAVTEAERAGHRVFWLDGRGIRDKHAFLDLCEREFTLPSYFGHNWDALEDCLTDLAWVPAITGYLVVYEGWRDLRDADPVTYDTVTEILDAAIAYWRDTTTPMTVLLPA